MAKISQYSWIVVFLFVVVDSFSISGKGNTMDMVKKKKSGLPGVKGWERWTGAHREFLWQWNDFVW